VGKKSTSGYLGYIFIYVQTKHSYLIPYAYLKTGGKI